MAPVKERWADAGDDSSDEEESEILDTTTTTTPVPEKSAAGVGGLTVPPTHTSRIDSKGIQVVTSYRLDPANPNRLLKTTTTTRVTHDKVLENVAVAARRKWKKFGLADTDEDQSNVTIHSREDIYLEDPHADIDLQEEDAGKAISGNLNAFWAKQNMRTLQRKYEVDGDVAMGGGGLDNEGGEDGWTQVGSGGGGGGAGGGAKFVPPSARGGGGAATSGMGGKSLAALAASAGGGGDGDRRSNDNRDQNTIRVTNISEDTTEADLQELFSAFGRISRVYLAKDKETLQSRGFAFVSFIHQQDAAMAMAKLQGHGYDHLILKLEWARPSAPKDPAGGTQFRSGYGKALAQDTKEKVSFASNLTTGVR